MTRRTRPVARTGLGVLIAAGCAAVAGCTGSAMDTGSGVVPLAKVEGWRAGADMTEMPYGLLEVAGEAATAEQAWAENVPDQLGEGDGDQGRPGVYGSLDGVDLDTQALVVWHSGESGSCPGWLADIDTEGPAVIIERGQYVPGDACTGDYNPYRMVLAVDRDLLPALAALPTEDVTIDGIDNGRVSTYPDEVFAGG